MRYRLKDAVMALDLPVTDLEDARRETALAQGQVHSGREPSQPAPAVPAAPSALNAEPSQRPSGYVRPEVLRTVSRVLGAVVAPHRGAPTA